MAKKAGGPAWLATFADLMSLLMALFVLLFAMSNPEDVKYHALVESLTEALGHGQELTPEQLEFFKSIPDLIPTETQETPPMKQASAQDNPPVETDLDAAVQERMRALYEELKQQFSQESGDGNLNLAYDANSNQIKMIFPEQIAFDQGSAELKPRFQQLLKNFASFGKEPIVLEVVGHTDSVPIATGRFVSNWELSSARAASVITQLIRDGSVRPDQVQAVGLADTQPIAQGNSPAELAKNRRVEVLITPESFRPK